MKHLLFQNRTTTTGALIFLLFLGLTPYVISAQTSVQGSGQGASPGAARTTSSPDLVDKYMEDINVKAAFDKILENAATILKFTSVDAMKKALGPAHANLTDFEANRPQFHAYFTKHLTPGYINWFLNYRKSALEKKLIAFGNDFGPYKQALRKSIETRLANVPKPPKGSFKPTLPSLQPATPTGQTWEDKFTSLLLKPKIEDMFQYTVKRAGFSTVDEAKKALGPGPGNASLLDFDSARPRFHQVVSSHFTNDEMKLYVETFSSPYGKQYETFAVAYAQTLKQFEQQFVTNAQAALKPIKSATPPPARPTGAQPLASPTPRK